MKNEKLKMEAGSCGRILNASGEKRLAKRGFLSAKGVWRLHNVHNFRFYFLIFNFLFLIFTGCTLFKAQYDPEGQQYAVTLKEEALALMAKANESYYQHKEEVYRLMSTVEQAYEHSRGQRKNDLITGIWNVLRDPQGNRLGGFMEEWKREDILDDKRIQTVKKWVEEDFETIITLEKKKSKKLGKIE